MKQTTKKIGAFALAGVLLGSVAAVAISSINDDTDISIEDMHNNIMQAFDKEIENTILFDSENTESLAIPSEKIVKYSTLGC